MTLLRSHAALARRQTVLSRFCSSILMVPGILAGSLLLALLAMFIATPVNAQTSTWNQASGNWSADANWLPALAPVSGTSASLIFGGSTSYTATNDIGPFSLNRLQFVNSSGTVTLDALQATHALTFVNAGDSTTPALTLAGSGSATISAPVNWSASTAITNSGAGTLELSGTQTFTNGTKQTYTNSGTGSIILADNITYATTGTNNGLVLNLINNSSAADSFTLGNVGTLTNTTVNVGGTGTVRFNGNTTGTLFSPTTLLNVLSGATFDFNGNTESFGAISGEGTITTTVGLTTSQAGYYAFSGKLTGTAGSITVGGTTHTLVLSGTANDYTGTTTITAGRLIVSANAPDGSAGALGNATSDVLVGNTSGSSAATLVSDIAGVTIGRNIRVQSVNTGVMTVGGINTSGTVTYSGNVILGTNSAAAKGVTLTAAPGGTVEFTGGILRATSGTGTTDTLTVAGGGTVALRGTNSFTGSTTINAGTLLLDYTTNNTRKLSPTAALILTGGSITLNGSGTAASSQAVNGLTLGNTSGVLGGGGRITVTAGSGQTAALALGAIARRSGATVDFNPANTGASITTTTVNNTSVTTGNDAMNILGAYATYKLNDWAVNDGTGTIAALAAGSYTTTLGSGLHTSLSANTAVTTSPATAATTNALRLTGAAALTFNAATDTLTLESGGLLVASTAGATSIGATSKRGILATSTGELIVQQQSASTLTINANISGTNLVKSGSGTLVLTGTNTYTGNTILNGGTLSVTATANLGAATTGLIINGGTLLVPSGSITVSNTAHIITVGPAGATFNFAVGIGFSGNGFTGTGTVTKLGAGAWNVGANSSSFSGSIIIGAGSLTLTSNQLKSVAGITVSDGATYGIIDDGIGTFNIAAGARFLINGNGQSGNGAIRLTDQAGAVAGSGAGTDPLPTITNEVSLQTTSRIQVENGTAIGSQSQLILGGNVTGAGSLNKTGNGVLTLVARDNSYAGNTFIDNGTLRTDQGNDRLPTSTSVTLGAGATSGVLQLNGFSQTIAGLTTAGTGTANAVIGGSAASTSLLRVKLDSGSQTYTGTLGAAGVNNTHANNNIGLIKDGAGILILSGASTYNGTTSIDQGTLVLGNASALGGRGASLASGTAGTTVRTGATLNLNGQSNVQEVITLNGTGISDAGALVNNNLVAASIGSGVASLSFSGVSTTGWSAASTSVTLGSPAGGTAASATAQLGLGAASLVVTNGGSGFTNSSGVVTIVGGGGSGAVVIPSLGVTSNSFVVTSNTTTYSVAPTVTISAGNGSTATAVANLDGTGKVVSVTVTNPGSGYAFAPTITFAGGTVLTAGTAPTATGNTTAFTVVGLNIINGGTGYTSVPTVTITGGSGATAVANDNFVLTGVILDSNGSGYTSAPTVTINGGTAAATANLTSVNLASDSIIGGSGDLTINAVVSGDHALTKVGAGTTTLGAANTYTGTTAISAGTLQVGASGIGTSGLGNMILNGPTAVLAGTGSIQSPTTVSLGTIRPGDNGGASTGTLNTKTLVFTPVAATTVVEMQIVSNASFDALSITGDLTLNSSSNIVVNGSGYTAVVGDTFTLLDWSGLVTLNGFSTGTNHRTGNNAEGNEGNLDLPDITGTGFWEISNLINGGALTLTVVAGVPEPTRGLLLLVGGMTLLLRRRRGKAC